MSAIVIYLASKTLERSTLLLVKLSGNQESDETIQFVAKKNTLKEYLGFVLDEDGTLTMHLSCRLCFKSISMKWGANKSS